MENMWKISENETKYKPVLSFSSFTSLYLLTLSDYGCVCVRRHVQICNFID